MIRVTLLQKDGLLAGFECRGHAGYAPAGEDIVCAAVSVLTTTCVNAMETVAGVTPRVSSGEGRLSMRLRPGDRSGDAQVILRTLRQGLGDIAEQYPEYVSLSEKIIMEE